MCSDKYLKNGEKNFLSDKICINGCNNLPNNIINDLDGSYINKYNLTSEYKYLQSKTNENIGHLHFKKKCDTTLLKKRYSRANNICIP